MKKIAFLGWPTFLVHTAGFVFLVAWLQGTVYPMDGKKCPILLEQTNMMASRSQFTQPLAVGVGVNEMTCRQAIVKENVSI